MVHVQTPVLEAGLDALLAADGVQPAGGLQQGLLPAALTDDDQALLAVVVAHVVVIGGQVGQIQVGAVVVDQIIAVVAEELLVVIQTGDGKAAVKQIGTAVVQVGGVHGTHGHAEGHNPLIPVLGLDDGNHLAGDVVEPILVVLDAPAAVASGGSPGLVVDGIDAVDDALALVDPLGPVVGHLEALKVPETAGLAGDEHNRLARMAVDLILHIPAQVGAVMLAVLDFHVLLSNFYLNGSGNDPLFTKGPRRGDPCGRPADAQRQRISPPRWGVGRP